MQELKMLTKLLQLLLISSTLFSYEIQLDKKTNTQHTTRKSQPKVTFIRDDVKELVTDTTTGLIWQDNLATKSIRKNRKDAKDYCSRLVFAGYDDWHLPKIKELKSIVDHQQHNPAINSAFKNTASFHYWSASPKMAANMINVLNIDFKNGHKYSTNRRGRCNVRCVRGKFKKHKRKH